MTDDLQAGAVASRAGRGGIRALEAGADLLLFANQQGYDADIVHNACSLWATLSAIE